ncbi:MAG TPA: PIG-L family deacetylase [Mucilaginibacter sp.]|jgi:LmbE family N-acetylglucosaminyl deacetylase
MKPFILLTFCLFISGSIFSQTAPPSDLATIEQNFKKLDVLGSVLYVAAHPDDENTRLLAYLAQEKHYRTGYLSMTRGDGGQNLIGNEQGELLGLIRTQELLAARRVDGAEQFFTRANDFGFSKGPGETLKIWDKEKVLGDVVWVIRKFRPDVIICRFPTTGEGGHGHHTSSAILAQEAFTAAADPKRYPEQLRYVQPWQAKRLLWNTFNFGTTNTTAPDQFKINVGVYNPVLGKGYGEMAAESRSNHKTQGFGAARQRGGSYEFFKTILGEAPQNELMDGVNTTWSRIKSGEEIGRDIEKINKDFNIDHPDKSVSALGKLLDKIEKVPDEYWRAQKTKELNELIAACAGLWFEAYATEREYALGDQMSIRSQVISRYGLKIYLNGLTVLQHTDNITNSPDYFFNSVANYALPITDKDKVIPANELQTFTNDCITGSISQPYWLEAPHPIGTYVLANEGSAGNPENPDAPTVKFDFLIEGHAVAINRKLMYKYVNPAKGEIYQPVEITPPVTINIENKDYIFKSQISQNVTLKLKSFTKCSGTIRIKPIGGWTVEPDKIEFADKNKGDEWTASFNVRPVDTKPQTSTLQAVVNVNGKDFSMGIQELKYEHVPNITLFPPAEANLINIDMRIAGKKIGYIEGAGDLVPDALRQAGYDVHELTEKEIQNGDLAGYDAIVTGVRAYNVNPRLAIEQPKLLEYVKNGGNLVVQYNNSNGLVTKQIGPYPFSVTGRRVTDENAKVTVTDQQNAVLNYPNTITQEDFNGWVQERGLYYVGDIDPKYSAVLQMNDPGEAPNNGALIVGNYGQGRFVYTSLAFFRQLPAGVPGAYRLFINLLSKPKNQLP